MLPEAAVGAAWEEYCLGTTEMSECGEQEASQLARHQATVFRAGAQVVLKSFTWAGAGLAPPPGTRHRPPGIPRGA